MPTRVAKRVLAYLWENVVQGIESLEEAREFIDVLRDIDIEEQCFLRLALHDEECLRFFYGKFVGTRHPERRRDAPARRCVPVPS